MQPCEAMRMLIYCFGSLSRCQQGGWVVHEDIAEDDDGLDDIDQRACTFDERVLPLWMMADTGIMVSRHTATVCPR